MGYSQETSNYHLPLYEADDRPSYLGDWNETMGLIDNGMMENKNSTINNAAAVANMKTYVDNSVETLTTSVNDTVTKVTEEIETVQTGLTNLVASSPLFSIPKNGKMVCIGDSWLEGYSNTGTTTSWGTHLARILGIEGKNFYQGGAGFQQTSSNGKTFNNLIEEASVANSDASLVVIAGGINDRNLAYSAVKSAVQSTITNARSKFKNAVIWVFPMLLSNRYLSNNTLEIAKAICDGISESNVQNVSFNSGCWSWLYDNNALCADSLHPTNLGQQVTAQNMAVCMHGGDPYVRSSKVVASDNNTGLYVRVDNLVYMYLVKTTRTEDNGVLATFERKYTPGPFYAIALDTNDWSYKSIKATNQDNTFTINTNNGVQQQSYSTFIYAINDLS